MGYGAEESSHGIIRGTTAIFAYRTDRITETSVRIVRFPADFETGA